MLRMACGRTTRRIASPDEKPARSLSLAVVDGLNARTDDLRDVRAAVHAHGDNAGGKAREVGNPGNIGDFHADHGKTVEDEHQLDHKGRAADELDVRDRQPLERQNFAHAHGRHQRAKDRAEQDGERRDDERIDNALREKAGIALDDFSYRFKKSHGSLLLKNMQRAWLRKTGFKASPPARRSLG